MSDTATDITKTESSSRRKGDVQYDNESVSIAIITRNRFKSTVETLLQLDLTSFGEVILVDDSDDDSLHNWSTDKPITYYEGPGVNRQAARNKAISECNTAILAFIDDDVLLPADFASRIAHTFNTHPRAVAVGGPTLSPAVKSARDLCYREKMSVSPWTGTVHDDSYRWVPKTSQQVQLLKGANMCFLHDALVDIGGFDTEYGGLAQREETDVIVRLWSHGEIVYDPSLLCFHKQTGGDAFNANDIEWRFGNHGYFVHKNFGLLPFVLGVFSILLRKCGNPDSLLQLIYRRAIIRQQFSVINCLGAYLYGGIHYREKNR